MPTTFQRAEPEVCELMESVKQQYHQDLVKAKVSVGILMAFPPLNKDGQPTGPAIKGYGRAPAGACIRVVPLKDRVTKGYCAELHISSETWDELEDKEKVALLDHELEHIVPKQDKDGHYVTDDLNMAKIKLRPDSFIVWGFESVMRRHGSAALEWQSVKRIQNRFGQLLLDGIPQEIDAEVVEIKRGVGLGTVKIHAEALRKLEAE